MGIGSQTGGPQIRGTSAGRPMFPRPGDGKLGTMEIRIVLDEVDPPVGRVCAVDGSGVGGTLRPFVGWLELLRALYEVTGRSGTFSGSDVDVTAVAPDADVSAVASAQ